ncbi:hypothetical protein LY78DRAFT_141856 [Colletotrichum sublineola]|uniref:Uncharacterized protein n=1 Tax=Colletotrichum sublineola TaxID=1173701 RepID=A0A066WSP5_COLSU|nr:hypothetical protein LY78DRAFT_141856 [Colletotrichum sublineola]KDN59918.1 hypothetical protein CSUB01_03235 [Colletotrichum sublineola]
MAGKTTNGLILGASQPETPVLHTTIQYDTDHGKLQVIIMVFAVVSEEMLVTIDLGAILEQNSSRNIGSPLALKNDVDDITDQPSVFNIQAAGWDSFIPRIMDCL